MEYRLTKEEQIFAEENHNLVYTFLNQKGLDESEYYDIVIMAYLKSIRGYLINSKVLENKSNFSTLAWRAMQNAVNKTKKKEKSFASLDEIVNSDLDYPLIDILGHEDDFDEKLAYFELLKQIRPYLTAKEEEVLRRKADGYKYSDLAKFEGITNSGIGSRLSRARKKIRMILIEGVE